MMAECFSVMNPTGLWNEIQRAPLTPRPADLRCKTLFVIDTWQKNSGFEAFEPRLLAALTAKYPGLTIERRLRSGYAVDETALWDEVKAKADAFLYFGVPSCTPVTCAMSFAARRLEAAGVPGAVIFHAYFEEAALTAREKEGIRVRFVPVPYPCDALPDEAFDRLAAQVEAALLSPLTAEELRSGPYTPEPPAKICMQGTLEEVQAYFCEKGWTDGLPVVPPTEERVAAMLAGTSHAPEETVCTNIAPEGYRVTVEKAAVIAVMAGALPAYFPVILTGMELLGSGAFHATAKSTNSFSYMQVVNGPIRRELGMEDGICALGAGNRANAVIGRALRLALICLGGTKPGVTLMGVQGNVSTFSFAFAENEEASPWSPLSAEAGCGAGESTLTIFSGGWAHSGNYMFDPGLERVMSAVGCFEYCSGFAILMSPKRAKDLAEAGFDTREKIEDHLWQLCHRTKGEFIRNGHFERQFLRVINAGGGPYPREWLDLPEDAVLPMVPRNEIRVIVVGDPNGTNVMQAWNMYHPKTASIDRWR